MEQLCGVRPIKYVNQKWFFIREQSFWQKLYRIFQQRKGLFKHVHRWVRGYLYQLGVKNFVVGYNQSLELSWRAHSCSRAKRLQLGIFLGSSSYRMKMEPKANPNCVLLQNKKWMMTRYDLNFYCIVPNSKSSITNWPINTICIAKCSAWDIGVIGVAWCEVFPFVL